MTPEDLMPGSSTTSGSGTADFGTADFGTADFGTADFGTADFGTADLGTADLGTADLGTADFGTADLGTADFDEALAMQRCWLQLDDGEHHELPVWRWHAQPDEVDELMLQRCGGPTLDVGCGPGRLTGALQARGTVALGIDTSPRAVTLTSRRGGVALRQSVFDRVPAEGAWQHVLLADGNLGIGGDPPTLLGRVAQLLDSGGTVIVEVAGPGTGLRCGHARIGSGPSFPWSLVGVDAVDKVAASAGFRVVWDAECDDRWFAELAQL